MVALGSGQRAAKTLSGTLGERPLALLLASTSERGTSGTFTFRDGRREHHLCLVQGKVAVVRAAEPVAYLSSVLYELGFIDAETRDTTLLVVAKERRLHGEVLLERGAITHAQLAEALVEQTLRHVDYLFRLPDETAWFFREDICEITGERDEGRPYVDAWRAMWRGLCVRAPGAHVDRALAKLDIGLHLRDLPAVDRFRFSPEERALCERMSVQPTTIAALTQNGTLGAERTKLVVYALSLVRCVVRVQADATGPAQLGAAAVRERARRIAEEDPYTVLGLPAGASVEAARAAYFRLARLWHPDRLPKELEELRADCADIFMVLAEAHRVLTDRGMREAAARAKSAAATTAAATAPRLTMKDADRALARDDFRGAEDIAKPLTTAGAEGPAARAALAWCAARGGAAPREAIDTSLAILDKLLTGDPDCTRALYYRARLLERIGRDEQAMRDYRRCARLDPSHVDAVRKVRLHEMRHGASGGASGPASSRGSSTSTPTATPNASTSTGAAGDAGEDEDGVRSGLRRLIARVARR